MTPVEEQLVRELRAEVRVRDDRPDDGRCGHVADAICAVLGWKKRWGQLLLLDRSICWIHCWILRPDGSLVDAAADQFEARWPGDILVLAPDDPRVGHYRHGPPAWVFRTAVDPAGIGIVVFARRDGAEGEEPVARVEPAGGVDGWRQLARAAMVDHAGADPARAAWRLHSSAAGHGSHPSLRRPLGEPTRENTRALS